MIIQYCSDLHLEFPENRKYLQNNPIEPVGEILILAGDILPFAIDHHNIDFFDIVSENFREIYWLPGNHEYYYSDISDFRDAQFQKIRDNVYVVNNCKVEVDDVNLVFSTLWTKIKPENEFTIVNGLSDFQVIKFKGGRFLPEQYNHLHNEALKFISQEITELNKQKSLVISHHVPTLLNYPEQYKNDGLNDAFAVELYDIIIKSGINYWIYGHHHCNVDGFKIGATKLTCNQMGYVKLKEHNSFSLRRTIKT